MKILLLLGIGSWFLFGACDKGKDNEIVNQNPPGGGNEAKVDLTYLALGDSYTIGQSVATEQNFPNQLEAFNSSGIKVSAKIVAQTGWTTDNLINAIQSASLAPKYDFVTLLIGVNNQYRGYNINTYRKEFVQLLQTSIQYAGGNASNVFVLSIPDYSVTPFAGDDESAKAKIASEIDAYNQINKEETAKLKAHYLNITPISREADSKPLLIASDGLHPSAEMYKEWVKLLAPQVKASFGK